MIFCVEDDNGIRDLMIYALNSAGFEAKGFICGTELFNALQTENPQLIMLDIMLPGEDGIAILKRLRSNSATSDIPIIMATAKGTEYDKVIGLDLGADDYLAKPFGMMEMVSRVKAVLRRVAPKDTAKILNVGQLTMNMGEHTVFACGERISLTLKEYEMLRLFMENLGRVFTREQLLENIWEEDYVGETRTVDVHIGTLRTKLKSCSEYIETVRGVGYRMEARL
ncbi:MAG: response regulator transcription factor [Muribaculaceae bacterium]|nr:response regulator transcription factor [Muribaculaceae bacterium]